MKCYKDDGELKDVVTDYEYKGVIVKDVKALRCPVCGETMIPSEEVARIRRTIQEMLQPLKLTRKISSAGKRPTLYLPEDIVERTNIRIGDRVEIWTEGKRILIEKRQPD